MIKNKVDITKVLIEEDLRKSRDYEAVRADKRITSLITETDKKAYKIKVGEYSSSTRGKGN